MQPRENVSHFSILPEHQGLSLQELCQLAIAQKDKTDKSLAELKRFVEDIEE